MEEYLLFFGNKLTGTQFWFLDCYCCPIQGVSVNIDSLFSFDFVSNSTKRHLSLFNVEWLVMPFNSVFTNLKEIRKVGYVAKHRKWVFWLWTSQAKPGMAKYMLEICFKSNRLYCFICLGFYPFEILKLNFCDELLYW